MDRWMPTSLGTIYTGACAWIASPTAPTSCGVFTCIATLGHCDGTGVARKCRIKNWIPFWSRWVAVVTGTSASQLGLWALCKVQEDLPAGLITPVWIFRQAGNVPLDPKLPVAWTCRPAWPIVRFQLWVWKDLRSWVLHRAATMGTLTIGGENVHCLGFCNLVRCITLNWGGHVHNLDVLVLHTCAFARSKTWILQGAWAAACCYHYPALVAPVSSLYPKHQLVSYYNPSITCSQAFDSPQTHPHGPGDLGAGAQTLRNIRSEIWPLLLSIFEHPKLFNHKYPSRNQSLMVNAKVLFSPLSTRFLIKGSCIFPKEHRFQGSPVVN